MTIKLNKIATSNHYDTFDGKYAGYWNYVTRMVRCSPFFDTVQECEAWEKLHNVTSDIIRPVSNWVEMLAKSDNDFDAELLNA